MKRITLRVSLCLILLHACSPSSAPDTPTPPPPVPAESCGYQWAYQDLPELKATLDSNIKSLNPIASAWATAFGEACVFADGRSDFHAMETDFYIHLPVIDLADFESFGDWIAETMKVIESIPPEQIAGPQPGFVEFTFIKSDAERLIVRVPIQTYRDEAGKTGEELFRLFYIK